MADQDKINAIKRLFEQAGIKSNFKPIDSEFLFLEIMLTVGRMLIDKEHDTIRVDIDFYQEDFATVSRLLHILPLVRDAAEITGN